MPLPEDPATATALVHDDVRAAFGEAFPGDVSTPEPFETDLRIASATTIAVPWRWIGRHDAAFLDIPATGTVVDILGVTLLREDDEGTLVHHRLVDWMSLYQRLGVVIGSAWTLDRSERLGSS
jgi:hypothetical protein